MDQAPPTPLGGAPLLKAREVADWLRVSTNTVHRLAETGELPSARIGRVRRFSAADVEAYLSRKPSTTASPAPLRAHSA